MLASRDYEMHAESDCKLKNGRIKCLAFYCDLGVYPAGDYVTVEGVKVKKYRGMGSLEAQQKGSESRYYGDTQNLKIAQGVSGTVKDKGSIR